MFEDRVQCRDGSRGDAFAASGRAAPTADSWLRRLAGRDVGLGALDVAEFEGADLPPAEQRLDVGLNPAAIHRQCGSLDGAPAPAKDAARLGLGNVPVADLCDGQESGRLGFFGDRIDALGHGDELLMGKGAGLLDGHQPIAPMTTRRGRPSGVRYWMTKLLRPDGMTCTPNPRSSRSHRKLSRTLTPTFEGSGAFRASTTRLESFSPDISAIYWNSA
jgi:hypothetical protein